MAKSTPRYTRIAQLKTVDDFHNYLHSIGADLPFNGTLKEAGHSPLADAIELNSGKKIGNRFCILPMEGWDGTTDGLPTEHTRRRWHHFAISGAKLLWGCEAVAVRDDGKANPNQLLINKKNQSAFAGLYNDLISDHEEKFGTSADLMVGLQLTHSGRFAVPDTDRIRKPKILYRHSKLDNKFGISSDYPLMTDSEIDGLVEDFVIAAKLAHEAGFEFVDIKHCHGYLGHEFLSAYNREGKYGGSLENRMRFLMSIIEGIRAVCDISIGVRLSVFDWIPFRKNEEGVGIPEVSDLPYREAFGCDGSGTGINLTETFEMLGRFEDLGIELVCITAGSPYYIPHIQRPALFPPSDGYLPPEDPLIGVARQIHVTHEIKKKFPKLTIIGSAYSYLQEWLPNVSEAVIEGKMADIIGLGRMVLSYPEFPIDVLSGKKLDRVKLCRTFSDCTTAPRNAMISGCYPLDPYYKKLPEASVLKELKKNMSDD